MFGVAGESRYFGLIRSEGSFCPVSAELASLPAACPSGHSSIPGGTDGKGWREIVGQNMALSFCIHEYLVKLPFCSVKYGYLFLRKFIMEKVRHV